LSPAFTGRRDHPGARKRPRDRLSRRGGRPRGHSSCQSFGAWRQGFRKRDRGDRKTRHRERARNGGLRMNQSDIEAAFEATDAALVPYITAGDPNPEATAAQVRALAAGGADVIELGLPFSEPIADGPTIQNAIQRALDTGMTADRVFYF